MGVWIEICNLASMIFLATVTPFVGVWIEIKSSVVFSGTCKVTPFVGVWIEIPLTNVGTFSIIRHSLRGSVD